MYGTKRRDKGGGGQKFVTSFMDDPVTYKPSYHLCDKNLLDESPKRRSGRFQEWQTYKTTFLD